ncbi:MAG: heme exporter protein CcmB [Fimbriimonadaceae bacterium]|nr:heme exporter protein CcmB [Fimbriimonadaceae bacterium]
MSWSWLEQTAAVVKKEWTAERRDTSASVTALVLSFGTVFTLAFAFYGRTVDAPAAAGMMWAALLFAGVSTLTRTFVAEDEQGTGDLLRVWSQPYVVFWGKAAYACLQMAVVGAVVALSFVVLMSLAVKEPLLFFCSLGGGVFALGGTVTLTSAIISRGANRSNLSGVVALPLLLPLLAMGVASGRSALEGSQLASGWQACAGTWLYTLVVFAVAPHLFAAIWREP